MIAAESLRLTLGRYVAAWLARVGVTNEPLYIRADRLFDGRALISGRVAVAVRRGKVVTAGRLRIPRSARVIRLRRATILPGIIDLHVHSTPAALLRAGVTTTRNVGEPEAVLRPPFTLRRYPRVVSAGRMITVPGGYPTGRAPGTAAPVTSAREAAAKVDALVAKGAALIKISLLAAGEEGRPLPTLSVDQVQAIVAAAHKHRRIVTAHVLEGMMQQAGLSATRVPQAATADAGRELGMAPLGTRYEGRPWTCGPSEAIPPGRSRRSAIPSSSWHAAPGSAESTSAFAAPGSVEEERPRFGAFPVAGAGCEPATSGL